jgi:hypothetical protein
MLLVSLGQTDETWKSSKKPRPPGILGKFEKRVKASSNFLRVKGGRLIALFK